MSDTVRLMTRDELNDVLRENAEAGALRLEAADKRLQVQRDADTAAHYAREDKRWDEESKAVERRLLASMAAYLLAHKPTDAADAVAAARIILAEVDRTEPSK